MLLQNLLTFFFIFQAAPKTMDIKQRLGKPVVKLGGSLLTTGIPSH